jgi:hypothetical protein
MYYFPFKNPKVADHFAEALLKAGFEGKLTDFCKVSDEYKLVGEEISRLFIDQKAVEFDPYFGRDIWTKHKKDGKAINQNPWSSGTDKFWIENDMICYRWEHRYLGSIDCRDVYKNPSGTSEMRNEYLFVSDYVIQPFSLIR